MRCGTSFSISTIRSFDIAACSTKLQDDSFSALDPQSKEIAKHNKQPRTLLDLDLKNSVESMTHDT